MHRNHTDIFLSLIPLPSLKWFLFFCLLHTYISFALQSAFFCAKVGAVPRSIFSLHLTICLAKRLLFPCFFKWSLTNEHYWIFFVTHLHLWRGPRLKVFTETKLSVNIFNHHSFLLNKAFLRFTPWKDAAVLKRSPQSSTSVLSLCYSIKAVISLEWCLVQAVCGGSFFALRGESISWPLVFFVESFLLGFRRNGLSRHPRVINILSFITESLSKTYFVS